MPTPTPESNPEADYLDERLGVGFSYPEGWTSDARDRTAIQLNPSFDSFVLVVTELTGPTAISTQLTQVLSELLLLPGFREISTDQLPGDSSGFLIRYEDSNFRSDFMIQVEGARVFIMWNGAVKDSYKGLEDEFDRLRESFQVTLPIGVEGAIAASDPIEDILDEIGDRVAGIRGSSGPHHQDSGEAKIRESTAGVSRKPSSDGKARGCSSKHLCGLTAWNT